MAVHHHSREFDAIDRQVDQAVIAVVGPRGCPRARFHEFRFGSGYQRIPR